MSKNTKFDYFQTYIDSTKLPIHSVIDDNCIQLSYKDHYIKIASEKFHGLFHIHSTSVKMDINMYGNTKDCIIDEYINPFIDIVLVDEINERMNEMKIVQESLLKELYQITSTRDECLKDRQKIIEEYEMRLKTNSTDTAQIDEKINALKLKQWNLGSDETLLKLSYQSIKQKIKNAEC